VHWYGAGWMEIYEIMGRDGWLVRSVLGLDGVDGGHRAGNET
jgi:hypothetical protein